MSEISMYTNNLVTKCSPLQYLDCSAVSQPQNSFLHVIKLLEIYASNTSRYLHQPDVAWTLSVDADDLGIKASGIEAQRRKKSTSEQSQRTHTIDHQTIL
jgi:hypothetical protein